MAVAVATVYILRREYYILCRSIGVHPIFYFYLTYRRLDDVSGSGAYILSRHSHGGCKRSNGPLSHGRCCCILIILRRGAPLFFGRCRLGLRQNSFSGGIKGRETVMIEG